MMAAAIVLGVCLLVAICFAEVFRREAWYWKRQDDQCSALLDAAAKRAEQERSSRIECEQKCSECFLDQAELRNQLAEEKKGTDLLRREVAAAEEDLASERRSNAALRGQLTKLKGKKA